MNIVHTLSVLILIKKKGGKGYGWGNGGGLRVGIGGKCLGWEKGRKG